MGPERVQEVRAPGGPLWPRPVLQALRWSCSTAGPEQLPLPSQSPALPKHPPAIGVPLVGLCRVVNLRLQAAPSFRVQGR